MKTIFIPVVSRLEPNYVKISALVDKKIPEKKIALCYSNQFVELASKLEMKLNKEIVLKIQVLGCSNPKFPQKVEAILVVGQGAFHSASLAYESKLPTYILEGESVEKVEKKEIEKLEKKEKGMYLKYLNSKKIGVLVTNKPGQQRLKRALEFKRKAKNKKIYLFIANDLNISEFENFQIDCWVNTACPRMDLTEGSIINLDKLLFFLK